MKKIIFFITISILSLFISSCDFNSYELVVTTDNLIKIQIIPTPQGEVYYGYSFTGEKPSSKLFDEVDSIENEEEKKEEIKQAYRYQGSGDDKSLVITAPDFSEETLKVVAVIKGKSKKTLRTEVKRGNYAELKSGEKLPKGKGVILPVTLTEKSGTTSIVMYYLKDSGQIKVEKCSDSIEINEIKIRLPGEKTDIEFDETQTYKEGTKIELKYTTKKASKTPEWDGFITISLN